MKKLLPFLIIICFVSCNKSKDITVAEVYGQKLYLSEIRELIPDGLNAEDSTALATKIVDDWIRQQVILYEANSLLSVTEKNFDRELENYKKNLLINAFYQKLTENPDDFPVSDKELNEFMLQYEQEDVVDREIVKLNYIKLSPKSKILKEIKGILFDEVKRLTMKDRIETLCADSIEYFIENNTWLYLDEIKNDLPASLNFEEAFARSEKYMECQDGKDLYLIALLDYKKNRSLADDSEKRDAAKLMLMQQKKREFISKSIENLYQKAIEKDKILR